MIDLKFLDFFSFNMGHKDCHHNCHNSLHLALPDPSKVPLYIVSVLTDFFEKNHSPMGCSSLFLTRKIIINQCIWMIFPTIFRYQTPTW